MHIAKHSFDSFKVCSSFW